MSRHVQLVARIEADARRRKAKHAEAVKRRARRCTAKWNRAERAPAKRKRAVRRTLAVLKDAPPEVVAAFREASPAVRRLIVEQHVDAARPFTTRAPDVDAVYAVTEAS